MDKQFWVQWKMKLACMLISAKIWITAGLFIFVAVGYITPVIFGSCLGAVLAVKGLIIAHDFFGGEKNNDRDIINKV